MTNQTNSPSRRTVLGALAVIPAAIVAAPAIGQTVDRSTWESRLAEFRRRSGLTNAHPYGNARTSDPGFDELEEEHSALVVADNEALELLLQTPAPDLPALAEKLEILAREYGDTSDGGLAAAIADVRRLNGGA